MPVFSDDLGRFVEIGEKPNRIISLCPSQSETLAFLAGDSRIAGITKFCIHPNTLFKSAIKVGGTKKVNINLIDSLHPDLIVCEKEENTPEMVAELESKWPVYVTDVRSVADAYKMVNDLGRIVGEPEKAEELVRSIVKVWPQSSEIGGISVAYLIWKDPWMAAGSDTYIDSVLSDLGFYNVFTEASSRYPVITLSELGEKAPKHIFLSSEPFPFSEKHIQEIQLAVPNAFIHLVDGEWFSWYGVRMLESASHLQRFCKEIIHGAN